MSKEPGELAHDAWVAAYGKIGFPWRMLGDDERAEWAAVESAIRADEAAKSQAEIARLREALERIADECDIAGVGSIHSGIARHARAALKGEPG
jgi:hypothetical protein